MAADWSEYQDRSAAFFRSLGLEASTNVTIRGVRTTHDIDVVVKSRHVGFDITWLVECKHWRSRVSKVHVLALREIVAEVGADRGFILCEAGFQSGAVEAANLTNVRLTSLEGLRATAGRDITAMQLREVYDRIENCREQYWRVSRQELVARLRHGVVEATGPSGAEQLEYCRDLLGHAMRNEYPFTSNSMLALLDFSRDPHFQSPEEVLEAVIPILKGIEEKVAAVRPSANV